MRVYTWQIVAIVVIALMLFGAPKLPELARSLGKSMRILKEETQALANDSKDGAGDGKPDKKD